MSNTRPGRGRHIPPTLKEASDRATRSRGSRDHPELLLNYARLRASQHAYWQDTLANDHKPGVRGI